MGTIRVDDWAVDPFNDMGQVLSFTVNSRDLDESEVVLYYEGDKEYWVDWKLKDIDTLPVINRQIHALNKIRELCEAAIQFQTPNVNPLVFEVARIIRDLEPN